MECQCAAGDRFPEESVGEGFEGLIGGSSVCTGQTGAGEKQSRRKKSREKKNNEEGLFAHTVVAGRPGMGIFLQSGRKDCG